jgi:hypothetical protein
MERSTKLAIALLIAAAIISAEGVWAAVSISVTGDWFETIDETDLAGGAGSDLVSTYESAADQVSIDIADAPTESWRVDVRKVDTDWHGDLSLYVRRTSDGSGSGSIAGGASYQQISSTYQEFFSGSLDRSGITAQLMLDGVSAAMGCGNYLTTVYYTVVEVE